MLITTAVAEPTSEVFAQLVLAEKNSESKQLLSHTEALRTFAAERTKRIIKRSSSGNNHNR